MDMVETPSPPANAPNGTDPLLIEFLAERSVACPVCGYDLRMLQRPACPECGEDISLRVVPREPRLAAFLTGLIGLAVALGPSALLTLIFAYFFVTDPSNGLLLGFLLITAPTALISGGAMIGWLRFGRRLRRSGDAARWTLALLCWIPAPVGMALLLLYRLTF